MPDGDSPGYTDCEFKSTYGFAFPIDFLDMLEDSGFLREFTQYSLIDGVPVTALVDLSLGKGGS